MIREVGEKPGGRPVSRTERALRRKERSRVFMPRNVMEEDN